MNDLVKKTPGSLVIASFAAIYIIWGSTYLAILIGLETIPPFFLAGTRFLTAGLLLLAYAFYKGEKLPDTTSLLRIGLAGILMLYIGNGTVTWVEQHLPSGLAAIIVATVPLWLVILDRGQWKFYFSNIQIIGGLLVGFAGVILLFAGNAAGDLFSDPLKFVSLLVLMGGIVSWSIGTLFSKYKPMQGSTTMKVAVQSITAGLFFIPTGFISGEHEGFSISDVSTNSLLALFYLTFFGSILAYLAYMWLLSVKPASLVGTYAYVNPVVAVFLGWLIAAEQISMQQAIGLGVIILGLIIVNMSKEKKSPLLKPVGKGAV